jgi:hypothetical protein
MDLYPINKRLSAALADQFLPINNLVYRDRIIAGSG